MTVRLAPRVRKTRSLGDDGFLILRSVPGVFHRGVSQNDRLFGTVLAGGSARIFGRLLLHNLSFLTLREGANGYSALMPVKHPNGEVYRAGFSREEVTAIGTSTQS